MADANAHKLGQMIGEFIEKHFEEELRSICHERGLYLDAVGKVRNARKGKKVKWVDVYGSHHDLDFVIERNGTDDKLGVPAALIECAWRRYTKHSKNKAQEIQGAILPIAEKHKYHKPFLGAVIAGEFTAPSISQLNSCGFETLYIDYQDIVNAFSIFNIDISFEEDTPDAVTASKIESLKKLTDDEYLNVFKKIITLNADKVRLFKQALTDSLDRQISHIVIAPLYGASNSFETIDDALNFIVTFNSESLPDNTSFKKLHIAVEYSNSDRVTGDFSSKENAEIFLKSIINQ